MTSPTVTVRGLPGPPPLPALGNLPDLMRDGRPHRGLHPAHLAGYFPALLTGAGRLASLWAPGGSVAVLPDLRRYTLDVTFAPACGHDLNSLENPRGRLATLLPTLLPAINRRMSVPVPYWRWVRLPADRRLATMLRELDRLIRIRTVAARERMTSGAAPRTVLESLVSTPGGEEPFTPAELFGNVLTMLLAGEDTTASAIAWTLHHLAADTAAQGRLRAEVAAALGGRPPADPSAVRALAYTNGAVREALRLHPVASLTVVEAAEETELPGGDGPRLRVGPGTPIWTLMTYGSRRDTRRFPEPGRFRPDRWLDPAAARQGDLRHLPFGAGPRSCPGRGLALLEATLVVALIVRDFDLAPDPASRPRERVAFTVSPAGLRVRLTRR
ncbi:Epi-isozizaene 5-monooxygenase/(E)-beta-farnesene synthase [Actinoplanes philippinensis]|uniref:cytochrome P450 n=1 Tax=Actinoplanes philippinensis TaxID=35752 RepID=UPI0015A61FE7|nr:cytochrome P450 [Actinoplanes philippinensis]GIE74178.1 Epi-isozizaene 5-monooxygenase/(E)-beta-farnesene synthase [Actinoplanes philippinensis]